MNLVAVRFGLWVYLAAFVAVAVSFFRCYSTFLYDTAHSGLDDTDKGLSWPQPAAGRSV